jgi:hypothetical protein
MRQFRTLSDIHKFRAEQFARALIDVMAGMRDSKIQCETGLDEERCQEISQARADAMLFLEIEKK